ncbi:unnamed protein product [Tilletia laevis]|uniref:Uncharacterized protein n=4 Tax=Tilletia TaxID=13289 RepID=A0A9N8QKE8_9BASI|nr:hypothetical protein CF335_g1240 [Tilletia laevis]CAD6887124.1 unnamed protein product [Tilletia caries]CAD6916506.1 unnamed protein product [Tilletia laevis]CAD6947799.1 unnamed protein product [Tilletia laevis]CAD6955677.1 unnamed protein product [Tilletia caries]
MSSLNIPIKANNDGEQVPEGYYGNLSADQQRSLREMWRRFHELYERNVEKSQSLEAAGGPTSEGFAVVDESKAKKGPKGDAAMDDAKKAEEVKEMNQFIDKYGGPYLRKAFWEFTKLDHPDVTMLRFLRARKWDVDRALAMLAAALKFRLDKDIEGILEKGEDGLKDVPGFLNQFRRGISYIRGNTAAPGEYPIYFIHVGRHFTSAQKTEVLQQFVLLAMENARLLVTPPYEKAIVIFDMTGFGLRNMDWQCVLFLVKCLEAYFPESLQRIYIHAAPWIFKGIWQILQPMLDPVVRDKIKFSSKASELVDYVPYSKLRKAMGGTMQWEWNYIEPTAAENELMKDTATATAVRKEHHDLSQKFEEVTRAWSNTKDDSDAAAKDLNYRRLVLGKQLRLKQFQMNPYIRARSIYHRDGSLKEDGSWSWTYPQEDGKINEQTTGERHNIPALQKWLREHNEDDLSSSIGGRHGAMGPQKGKPLPEKDRVTEAFSIVGGFRAIPLQQNSLTSGAKVGSQAQAQEQSPPTQQQQHSDGGDGFHSQSSHISTAQTHAGAAAAAAAAQQQASLSLSSSTSPAMVSVSSPSSSLTASGEQQRQQRIQHQHQQQQQQQQLKPPPSPLVANRADSSLSVVTTTTEGADEFYNAAESLSSYAPSPAQTPTPRHDSSGSEGYIGSAFGGALTGATAAAYLANGNPQSQQQLRQPLQDGSGRSTPTGPAPAVILPTADSNLSRAGDSIDGSEQLHSHHHPLDMGPTHHNTTHHHHQPPATPGSEAPYELDEDGRALSDEASIMTDQSITPETEVRLSFIPTRALKESEVQISDDDIRDDLALVRGAMSLFLNSRMQEAEDICIQGADRRLYKAVGMALINTVKAVLTFEPQDFINAIACNKHSMAIASLLRRKKGARKVVGNSQTNLKNMTVVQLHAELIFAESQVLKSILGIFYAGDALALVRNAFDLRNGYFLHREMLRFVEWLDAEQEQATILASTKANTRSLRVIDQDFRSGVYFGNGLSTLVLSFLPASILKVIEKFGFVGERKMALDLLQRAGGWSKQKPLPTISTDEEGVRRPLADIAIMCYHLIFSSYVPITDVDIDMGDKILSWNLVRFPQGIFFLYFSARLYGAQALPEKAIEYYRNAIEAQREYKQLHHLCFWDLSLTYLATCDFARAYECYDVLSRESNWSKAIYQYSKAVMLYETGMNSADAHSRSPSTIMRTVPKLTKRIAGRQIPFERFVAYKAKKYIACNNRAPLPGLEFSYLWHCIGQSPVFLLVSNSLARIDEMLDELATYTDPAAYGTGETEYYGALCLANFLRGVTLRFIAHPESHTLVRLPADDTLAPVEEIERQAAESFATVLKHGSKLDAADRYLVYFSHYEWGRLKASAGDDDGAKKEFKLVLSGKALEARGKSSFPGTQKADYLLQSMCMVRAHAALETLRVQKGRSTSFFASESSTFIGSTRPGRSDSILSTSVSSSGMGGFNGSTGGARRQPVARHSIVGSPNTSLQKTGTVSSRHSVAGSFSFEH